MVPVAIKIICHGEDAAAVWRGGRVARCLGCGEEVYIVPPDLEPPDADASVPAYDSDGHIGVAEPDR